MPKSIKKVGLCLGGGGALGVAHIGFIDELINSGIPIDMIAGTSIGAFVGGLFAAGMSPAEMKEHLMKFRRFKVVDLNAFAFAFARDGLVVGRRIVRYLNRFIKDKTFNDLIIPFKAIACDIVTGKEEIICKGNLTEAIRCSTSVPGIFKPVKKGKKILVDGGIVDNLPVSTVREMGADIVVTVDLHSAYTPDGDLNRFMPIGFSAISIMFKTMAELMPDKGDVYVAVRQPDVSAERFTRAEINKSLEYGKLAAREVADKIKRLM